MKLNWGNGIAIFYGAFMLCMIVFVVKSRDVDHSLVVDNYYEKDIHYQAHMDRVANSRALVTDLTISEIDDERVEFQFPEVAGQISGEIWFYRPSDKSRDFKVAVKTDASGLFAVNTSNLVPGLWILKVDWKAGDKLFYKEQEFYL